MKNIIILFFSLICFWNINAQITGTVLSDLNEPVEFATIENINQKYSAITNTNGIFRLNGEIGDSIRIQHVNYLAQLFVVNYVDANYYLSQKNINIGEVTVTAKYAINLFRKSCINTFSALIEKNIYRGYFRYQSFIDKDTSQIIDLDLDIIQRKKKSIEEGERINPYKIQERNEHKPNTPFFFTSSMFTHINQIYNWANFLGNSYSLKVEDSLQIRLYFIGKSQNVEVAIQKKDTLLIHVIGVTAGQLRSEKGEQQLKKNKMYWHIKYEYENGVGYLSEFADMMTFANPKDSSNTLTFSQFYKTYETGFIKRRPNGRRVFSLWLLFIKNRYNENFWERYSSDIDLGNINHTMQKVEERNKEHLSGTSNSFVIRPYKMGYHK
jgi:hypothetical protein